MAKSSLPLISIVSINWNSCQDTLELLSSIEKADYPKTKLEVIIVDNGSTDGSQKKIKNSFPQTKVIELEKNIGIPARNKGLKKAKGDIIYSIDSDVTVSRDFFKTTVKIIESDPQIGVLGVKVLGKTNRKIQPNCIKFNKYTAAISPLKPKTRTTQCSYLAGLVHIFPRRALKKIGLYEPTFFFYCDDLDLCLRAKKQGYKILYSPNTKVFHGKSKTSQDLTLPFKLRHYYKTLFRVIWWHSNIVQKISAYTFQLLLIPIYRLILKRENTFPQRIWGLFWNFKHTRKETKIMSLILLLALLLRLLAINTRSFWYDEAFTYHIAVNPLKELLGGVLADNNPPLYYLLIHIILKFSSNEIALRLPSVFFSLLTIYLIYSFFPKTQKRTGLIASSLFAFSPLSIYMATETRLHVMTTTLIFATILSFFSFLKNPSKNNSISLTVLLTLSLYTQYYSSLLLLPFFLITLKKKSKALIKKFLPISLISIILFSPWIFISLLHTHNSCSCPNTILSLPSVLASPTLGGIGEITLRFFPQLPTPITLFFIIASLLIFFFFLLGLTTNLSLSAIYFLPLTILSILGLFAPIFSPKAFAVFSPIFFLITAYGLKSFPNYKKIVITVSSTLIVISLIQIRLPFFHGERLKSMYQTTLQDTSSPVAHTSLATYYSHRYYDRDQRNHILLTQNPLTRQTLKYIGGNKGKIDSQIQSLWLVHTQKWITQEEYVTALTDIHQKFSTLKTYKIDTITIEYLKKN